MAKEYRQRNPSGTHRQILLMDGEEKLWEMAKSYGSMRLSLKILDLLHASSYVWKAVQALYPQRTTQEQIPLVTERIRRIPRGEVRGFIRGFRCQAIEASH